LGVPEGEGIKGKKAYLKKLLKTSQICKVDIQTQGKYTY
jgi:hypothetical protein